MTRKPPTFMPEPPDEFAVGTLVTPTESLDALALRLTLKPEAEAQLLAFELTTAQRDRALAVLRSVLARYDRKAFARPEEQAALNEAEALCVEAESW